MRHLAPLLLATTLGAAEPIRPNVLVLITDDQRWDALGCVQREQGDRGRFPWLQTPRLDRLAETATRYRQAFVVCSLCSPSRAAMLTGRYNHQNGITGNWTPFPIQADTYPRRLAAAGYATGYFGKWHMMKQAERPGFASIATFVGQGRYLDCPFLIDGQERATQGWVDEVTADLAGRFIAERQADRVRVGRPWLAVVGFKTPHGPWEPPAATRALYADAEARPVPNLSATASYLTRRVPDQARGAWDLSSKSRDPEQTPGTPEQVRNYFRCITAMDASLGRILDAVETSGAGRETLVLFISDNGYYLGEHATGDKRSGYEESLRVPLLVRWPGQSEARVEDRLALNLDVCATICAAAGIEPPPGIQGCDLARLHAGPDAAWRNSFLFSYWAQKGNPVPTLVGLRTATAKLIRYLPGPHEECFDLERDPYELTGLPREAAQATALRSALDARIAELGWRETVE